VARRPSGTPGLSLEAVVAAAITYVDEHGLDALTMRALAASMGVYPAALYWYVGSKSRLVSLSASYLLGDVYVDHLATPRWQDWLIETAQVMRQSMHQHPNFATVFGSEIAVDMTTATPFIESLLGVLADAGFSDDDVVDAYNSYTGTVIGWVSVELSHEPKAAGRDKDWQSDFQANLGAVNPVKNPHIARALPRLANRGYMMRWESGKTNPLDSSYTYLIESLVLGFERKLASRDAVS
jgi:AcrR family transcriptional regulator